jgi:PAS domain S-box-containing protein
MAAPNEPSPDRRKALIHLASVVADTLRAPIVAVWRAEAASAQMSVEAVAGEDSGSLSLATVRFGQGGVGWVAANRTSLEVSDVFADPRFIGLDWWRSHGLTSFLGLPLVVDGRLLGVLAVNGRHALRPTPKERQTLADLAAQIGEMLAHARLAEETARQERALEASRVELSLRQRQTAGLLAIARIVGTTTDLSEGLRLMCRELARLTRADTVVAYQVDRDRGEVRGVAGYHIPPSVRATLASSPAVVTLGELAFGESLFGEKQVVWSDDAPSDPRFANTLFTRFPHQSCLMLPLVVGGETLGGFHLIWWSERRRFDAREIETLEAIAQQTGVLLRSARLLEALGHQTARLQALTRVNQLVSSSLELAEVLTEITTSAADLMGAPLATFWITDARARTLRIGAFSDADLGREFPVSVVSFDEGGAGWIAAHRQELSVPDVFAVPPAVTLSGWARRGLRSFWGRPIVLGETLLAVLTLHGHVPFTFEPDEHQLLDSFCRQAALAIRNAQLFDRAQEEAVAAAAAHRRYRSLVDRSLAGVFRIRRDGTIDECNDACARVFGYASADEIKPINASALYGEDNWDGLLSLVPTKGIVTGHEVQIPRRDGGAAWLLMNVQETDDGALEGMVIDVSDRKRVEDAERQAEALRAVTSLANAAAHEINNPLAVIVGHLGLLRREVAEQSQEHLDFTDEAVARIVDIVRRMRRITSLDMEDTSPRLPPMLDLRKSSEERT